jgi:chromosomal replication initiation ATPase DnaA
MNNLKYVRADYLMEHYPQVYDEIKATVLDKKKIYSLKRCFYSVCSWYGLTAEELKSRNREQRIVLPRHHFCWVVYRNRIDVSYPMLGRYLSRDHTTIVHAVETFERMKEAMATHIEGVDELIHKSKL